MAHATLRVLEGPLRGKAFPLPYRDIKIGRSQDSSIRLSDYDQVSREHARLQWDGSAFVITEISSKNGVVVGGRKVRTCALHNGDIVQLGDFVAELRVPAEGPEFATASPAANEPAKPASAATRYMPVVIAVAVLVLLISMNTPPAHSPSGGGTATPVVNPTPVAPAKPDGDTGGGSTGAVATSGDTGGTGGKQDTPVDPADALDAAIEKTKAATVMIVHQIPGGLSFGSGFCVGDPQTIVTNRHVVTDEQMITPQRCLVFFNCGTAKQSHVIVEPENIHLALDSDGEGPPNNTDLATLRVPESGPEPLPLGDTNKLHMAQKLYAVGFPHGAMIKTSEQDQMPNVSVIDETVQRLQPGPSNDIDVMQIGGAMTHGNSGGPIIDEAGNVVGVADQGEQDAAGIGYAIPSKFVSLLLAHRGSH